MSVRHSVCAYCRRPSQALAAFNGVGYCAGCLANRCSAHAAALAAKDERIAELEGERDALRHSESLIQADLGMLKTDCSTPTFELARNAVKRIEELERAARGGNATNDTATMLRWLADRLVTTHVERRQAEIIRCAYERAAMLDAALQPAAREGGE